MKSNRYQQLKRTKNREYLENQRDWQAIISKGTPIFQAFGIEIAVCAVSEPLSAKRMTIFIKAVDAGRQIAVQELNVGIQRDKNGQPACK